MAPNGFGSVDQNTLMILDDLGCTKKMKNAPWPSEVCCSTSGMSVFRYGEENRIRKQGKHKKTIIKTINFKKNTCPILPHLFGRLHTASIFPTALSPYRHPWIPAWRTRECTHRIPQTSSAQERHAVLQHDAGEGHRHLRASATPPRHMETLKKITY